MKTYIVLWENEKIKHKLEINVFKTYSEAKWFAKIIRKENKPKIIKVNFGVVEW